MRTDETEPTSLLLSPCLARCLASPSPDSHKSAQQHYDSILPCHRPARVDFSLSLHIGASFRAILFRQHLRNPLLEERSLSPSRYLNRLLDVCLPPPPNNLLTTRQPQPRYRQDHFHSAGSSTTARQHRKDPWALQCSQDRVSSSCRNSIVPNVPLRWPVSPVATPAGIVTAQEARPKRTTSGQRISCPLQWLRSTPHQGQALALPAPSSGNQLLPLKHRHNAAYGKRGRHCLLSPCPKARDWGSRLYHQSR